MYNVEEIKKILVKKKYVFYEEPFKLNIVAIRKEKGTLNLFDDTLNVIFKDATGKYIHNCWPLTTEAGLPYFLKPLNPKGTAILAEGQYVDVYQIGLHQGKYEALVQRGTLMVYRDNNKDGKVDLVNLQKSIGDGINIHGTKLSLINKIVSTWSAACQVLVEWSHFQSLMVLANVQKKLFGNKFTYTLLNTKDFNEK